MATLNTYDSARQKNPHMETLAEATNTSGVIADVYVAIDPRKRVHIEVDMNGDPLDLYTAKSLHSSGDLENAGQIWILNQSAITTDFQSGDIGDTGFYGVKLVFGTTTVTTSYIVKQEPVVNEEWKKQ